MFTITEVLHIDFKFTQRSQGPKQLGCAVPKSKNGKLKPDMGSQSATVTNSVCLYGGIVAVSHAAADYMWPHHAGAA